MHIKRIVTLTIIAMFAFFGSVSYTKALEVNVLTSFGDKTIKYDDNDFNSNSGSIDEDNTESDVDGGCEGLLSPEFISVMKDGYAWIQIIALLLTLVLGMLDFGKAVTSDDQEGLKKAGKKFKTRLIILIIIFLTPLIVKPVVNVFTGGQADVCGLDE